MRAGQAPLCWAWWGLQNPSLPPKTSQADTEVWVCRDRPGGANITLAFLNSYSLRGEGIKGVGVSPYLGLWHPLGLSFHVWLPLAGPKRLRFDTAGAAILLSLHKAGFNPHTLYGSPRVPLGEFLSQESGVIFEH